MRLELDTHLPAGLVSRAQLVGRVAEQWAAANLYCPACPSAHLQAAPPGTPAVDFTCPKCEAEYQVKSTWAAWGTRFVGAAYEPTIVPSRPRTTITFTGPTFRKRNRTEGLTLITLGT